MSDTIDAAGQDASNEEQGESRVAAATAASAAGGDERLAYRGVFSRMLVRPEIGAAIGAVAIWLFFWAVSVPFGTAGGAASILDVAASPLGIMAVAVAMLMIGGEFDLSTGAATGAFGILLVLMVRDVTSEAGGWGISLWWAIPLSFLAALLLGWFNGTVVERTGLPSFIVTLGSFFVIRGAKLGYSKQIVDQIQVGRLDELAINAEASGASDKGYAALNDVFAYEWLRNEHVWEWRDTGYLLGVFLGIALLVLSLYEYNFNRRAGIRSAGVLPLLAAVAVMLVGLRILFHVLIAERDDNPLVVVILALAGLAIAGAGGLQVAGLRSRLSGAGIQETVASLTRIAPMIPGVIVALFGVRILHTTDSVGGNTAGAAVIFVGALLGLLGWGWARYERAADSPEGGLPSKRIFALLATAAVTGLAAVAVAWGTDSENSTDVVVEWNLNGWVMTILSLVIALVLGFVSMTRGESAAASLSAGDSAVSRLLQSLVGAARERFVTTFILGFLIAIFFLDQATIQGARAVFFFALLAISIGSAFSAMRAARSSDRRTGSVLLLVISVAIAGLAFYVRADSLSEKFRTQAFSFILAAAALMAIWAIASMLFAERQSHDHDADNFARWLAIAGAAALAIGVTIRLLAVTQIEVDAGITPTKFSVRILWFLAFTAVATWVLGRTRFGSWTFAVGGNKDASRQVGVPAARTKTQLFMLTAAAAWLVGVLLAFRLNTIQASTGDGEEFEYIIAAVVGGNALTGGRGSTLGAAIGALIMAMSVQGIPSARWNSDWRFVFVGGILLLAVIANNVIRNRAEAAR